MTSVRRTEVSGAPDNCCSPLRCFGQASQGLCSTWLAEGTTQTLEVSRRALCLPTLPHCNRKVPFFYPSNWSREESSRKKVSEPEKGHSEDLAGRDVWLLPETRLGRIPIHS